MQQCNNGTNNPYRGRIARTKTNPAANLDYGRHIQNTWNSFPSGQTAMCPTTNVQQYHPPAANSLEQVNDWGDWDIDSSNNGNDSWNWKIDDQTDAQQKQFQLQQQQQHQQQQQQQRHIPQHGSHSQALLDTSQESCNNINGNRKSDVIKHAISNKKMVSSVRNESTSQQHMDSFASHASYDQHQYLMPNKVNSVKSDSPQWLHEQDNLYAHQSAVQPSLMGHTVQPTLMASNYNWNNDQQNALANPHWRNQETAETEKQTSNVQQKEHNVDNGDYTWPSTVSQSMQQSCTFIPAEEPSNKHNNQDIEQSNLWGNQSNSVTNKWQDQNSGASMPYQLLHQSSESGSNVNLWARQSSTTTVQECLQSNVQTDRTEWVTQEEREKIQVHDESTSQGLVANKNQQQMPNSPLQCTLPTTSTSAYCAPETATVKENVHSQTFTVPAANTNCSNEASVSMKDEIIDSPIKIHQEYRIHGNIFNHSDDSVTENNKNFDPYLKREENDVIASELSVGVSNMKLENRSKDHLKSNDQSQEVSIDHSPDEWNKRSSLTGDETSCSNTDAVDNLSTFTPNYVKSNTNTPNTTEYLLKQDHQSSETNQVKSTSLTTNLFGFDQWYNQNTPAKSSDNVMCANDNGNTSESWTTEQNVENYENIQQPREFFNLEVVAPSLQERDIYGSRDSINRETLDNDPKPVVSSTKDVNSGLVDQQEINNVEVPSVQQQQQQQTRIHQTLCAEQTPDNYEFATNDRNTFLETGELTDSHMEHERVPLSQDDENDEVPSDIPFLREVPGQSSSSIDPRRKDPTGQEQFVQSAQRVSDSRRNDPSGQEQAPHSRTMPERIERRDIPPGQERGISTLLRSDSDTLERRNDPSGRERSIPPQQSRNDPSGEERIHPQPQNVPEPSETREVLGRGIEIEGFNQQSDGDFRQIPGEPSNEDAPVADSRSNARIVTDQPTDLRSKREEAVGASTGETPTGPLPANQKNSYEPEDDDRSANSREDSRERKRDESPNRRRYEYDRKVEYFDRDRECERERDRDREHDHDYDDYFYDRRHGGDSDRTYNSRDDFDRREMSYREDERKLHSRDDLDRHGRDEVVERRNRTKEEIDERDGRRRLSDDRRRDKDDMRRRDRERDYDPRYNRDSRDYMERDRRRDDRRPRRYDEYEARDSYRRDYYDDLYGRNSRPSSRSSYNDRDREYYMRSRDPYYSYNGYNAYDYGAQYGNSYYAYLENMRRTNPAAYSEWYHKYYASQQQQQQSHIARGIGTYPEDRASVHSGRSSCDERNTGDKRTLTDASILEDSGLTSARMTPTKFSTSHSYGCFSISSLVHVHPSYPADGERAKVDVVRLDSLLLHDPVARELRAYPGPLIKQVGVTHKKTIIEYCENKIKKAVAHEEMFHRASYILLYELMITLIQQNGNVVGVDIAALLLTNKDSYTSEGNKKKPQESSRRESVISQRSSVTVGDGSNPDESLIHDKVDCTKRKTVEEMTDEFRNTLLYGLVQEALEYAMNEGLWGHALFLASKLDKRTHASVMTRFANSLSQHDPLQTLYQLHSGRVPSIITNAADPKWDDWRPHLAMIISNVSANPDINRRSVMTLGDALYAKGDIYAAHFCYILAQADFAEYGTNGAKLVLIGSDHHKPYSEFMMTEAVMLTEIYEYARHLSEPGFSLVNLQKFKFDLATKLIDYGLIEKALLYLEQIAVNIANEPARYKQSFIKQVYVLGDRIKYYDPVCKDAIEDVTNLTWLNNLAEIVSKCQNGEIIEEHVHNLQAPVEDSQSMTVQSIPVINESQRQQQQQQQQQQQWGVPQQPTDYADKLALSTEITSAETQQDWQTLPVSSNAQDAYDQQGQFRQNNEEVSQLQEAQQQDYWNQQTYYQTNYNRSEATASKWQHQAAQQAPYSAEQSDVDSTRQQEQWNCEPAVQPAVQPAISMVSSSSKQYDPLEELDALDMPKQSTKSRQESKKPSEKPVDKKASNGGGSWFGGLFSKLAPKPKNQMILPDDNNPTIVWDPVAKKWTNKEEDAQSSTSSLAPPPKLTDMGFKKPVLEQSSASTPLPEGLEREEPFTGAIYNTNPAQSGVNVFKLPKGRSMRANYVDVMNPNATKNVNAPSNLATPATSPLVPMAASSPQLFIPEPVNDPSAPMDFLTLSSAAPVQTAENSAQGLSRWSSSSSLSREVQSYTIRDPRYHQRNKGLMTFKQDMGTKDRPTKSTSQNRYPLR